MVDEFKNMNSGEDSDRMSNKGTAVRRASSRATHGESQGAIEVHSPRPHPRSYDSRYGYTGTDDVTDPFVPMELVSSQSRNVKVNAELSEHQLFLLHPNTIAFALKTKQWSKSDCLFFEAVHIRTLLTFPEWLPGPITSRN